MLQDFRRKYEANFIVADFFVSVILWLFAVIVINMFGANEIVSNICANRNIFLPVFWTSGISFIANVLLMALITWLNAPEVLKRCISYSENNERLGQQIYSVFFSAAEFAFSTLLVFTLSVYFYSGILMAVSLLFSFALFARFFRIVWIVRHLARLSFRSSNSN